MTSHGLASDAEERLLRDMQRLIAEAERLVDAAAPDDPGYRTRLAMLISDLGEVHQAMVEKCDAIRQQTDAVVHQMKAASAYHRAASTLSNGRKRPV